MQSGAQGAVGVGTLYMVVCWLTKQGFCYAAADQCSD